MFSAQGTLASNPGRRQSLDGCGDVLTAPFAANYKSVLVRRALEHASSIGEYKAKVIVQNSFFRNNLPARKILVVLAACRILLVNPPFVPPTFALSAFNCPHCGAFAAQKWQNLYHLIPGTNNVIAAESQKIDFSWCSHCKGVGTWYKQVLLIPDSTTAANPHVDMPEKVIADYNEARSVLQRSPRSAAALLRLSLQKLCKDLGEKGDNINDDIAGLVAKGLPVEVQQSLDIVRVVGNEQVHPGTLDVRDVPSVATKLFDLINFIVEERISRPKAIQALYSQLPASKVEGIEKRDSQKKASVDPSQE